MNNYEKAHVTEKCQNVEEISRKRNRVQNRIRNNTPPSIAYACDTATILATTAINFNNANASGNEAIVNDNLPVLRKNKTLKQYIENWFVTTKKKLNVAKEDFSIVNNNGIVCTRCNPRAFKSSVDDNGGWRPSSYLNHLRITHEIVEQTILNNNSVGERPTGVASPYNVEDTASTTEPPTKQ